MMLFATFMPLRVVLWLMRLATWRWYRLNKLFDKRGWDHVPNRYEGICAALEAIADARFDDWRSRCGSPATIFYSINDL